MGYKLVSEVLDYAELPSRTAKLLLVSIAEYCDNETRDSWPSVATLAKRAMIGERQAQYLLRDLEAMGFISVVRGGGRNHSNTYTIAPRETWGKGAIASAPIGDGNDATAIAPIKKEKVQFRSIKGAVLGIKGAVLDTKGAIASAPEPSLEPSLEPSIEPSSPGGSGNGKHGLVIPGADVALHKEVHDLYTKLYGTRRMKKGGSNELLDWIARYGAVKVRDALQAAWNANATSPAYALAVLNNDGKGKPKAVPKPVPTGGNQRW